MAGGIRERGAAEEFDEHHEINVTPFIDVMLVLLIIFMVAAPLATVDVDVDLPASTATPQTRPDKPLYLTLKSDLSLALGEAVVPRDDLAAALDAASAGNRDTRIFLRADKGAAYGAFMEVMNLLRDAGYLKIALVGIEAVPQPGAAPPPATGTGVPDAASSAPAEPPR